MYAHSGYLTNAVLKGLFSKLSDVANGPTASQEQIRNQDPVLLTPHLSLPVLSGHWWHTPGYLTVQASCGVKARLLDDSSVQSCPCGHGSFP